MTHCASYSSPDVAVLPPVLPPGVLDEPVVHASGRVRPVSHHLQLALHRWFCQMTTTFRGTQNKRTHRDGVIYIVGGAAREHAALVPLDPARALRTNPKIEIK